MTCGPRSYPGDAVAEFCQGQASVDSLYYDHFIGTNQTEALQTDLTRGDGVINGYSGNDVLYGSDRLTGPYGGEWFFQELGDAIIVGAGGPDIIWAGEGNDLLDGGPGNDTLAGEAGSDTYLFRSGSGQDVIQEATGYGAGGALTDTDTVWLGSHLTPQDIAVRRVGNNLVFALINTPDTLTVSDYFTNPLNRIERIQFQDGTVWTEADWLVRLNTPSAGDDVLNVGAIHHKLTLMCQLDGRDDAGAACRTAAQRNDNNHRTARTKRGGDMEQIRAVTLWFAGKIRIVNRCTSVTLSAFTFLLWVGACSAQDASITSPGVDKGSADDLVAALNRLFKRAEAFRVEAHPKYAAVLRIVLPGDGDGHVTSAEWCGPRMLRFYFGHSDYIGDEKIPKGHGTYLMDIGSRTVWSLRLLPGGGEVVNCSVDGDWFVYARRDGKDTIVGRYHLRSGKREDYVRLRDSAGQGPDGSRLRIAGVWSPYGRKIAHVWEKIDVIKTSEPVWEVFRVRRKFGQLADLLWLDDSSAVVLKYFTAHSVRNPPFVSEVAIDHSGDPDKPLQVLGPPVGLGGSPTRFGVLKPGRSSSLYGVVYYGRTQKDSFKHLRRCVIGVNALHCQPAIDGDPKVSTAYDVSPDGKVIYYQELSPSKPCVVRYDTTSRKKDCLWQEIVHELKLAPDGNWIAIGGLGANNELGFGVMRVLRNTDDKETVKTLSKEEHASGTDHGFRYAYAKKN
jgi:hypothetical protein